MKIKSKLILLLSILPVLFFLLIAIAWYQLSSISKIKTSSQSNYELSFLAEHIHREVKNEAISIRNLLILSDKAAIEKELSQLDTESNSISQDIATLNAKVTTAEQQKLMEELKTINQEFNIYKDQIVQMVESGNIAGASTLMNSKSNSIHEDFFQVISTITDHFETNLLTSFEEVSSNTFKRILIGSIFIMVSLLIITGFVFKNVWSISTRLNKVSSIMANVANGKEDLSKKVEDTAKDEIGDVAKSFNRMTQSLEEQMEREQKLLWNKSNMAEITTSLSGKHDLESLSRTFLSKIVPLVEACHAVFYIKSSTPQASKQKYNLLSSYAYKERKHMTTEFEGGEGLIGQAVLEKTPILLTNVPADYVSVKSGLGEATPLNLYVIPILFEGDVKAVLEMASFRPFSTQQQEFVEEVVKGLGIIIDSVMGRIQLARLLEESQALTEEVQAQSEELQSQQEELRASNEELEEQTQALRQSEKKLQAQQEELEQTNAELKEKALILENQNRQFEKSNREVEHARAELENKARELALSSKYKSEFLANMSHELRTPLNSLLILSQLLSDNHEGNLSEKQIEYAKTIYSSGNDLLTLINDILDLAKVESGKMDVNPSHIQMDELVEFIENNFRPIAIQKNIRFDIVLKDNQASYLFNDEQRLKQLLKNLLSNAFKFTQQGGIVFEIEANHNDEFRFSIRDTGIGIPKEKQELIFQAFQQADGTTNRKFGGTGLGLSICRELSELLGGRIEVESEEGKGSTFTFIVGDYQEEKKDISTFVMEEEIAATKEEAYSVEVPYKQYSVVQETDIKRLLIVDDDSIQRNYLMEYIGDKNVIIKAVSTGFEAIEELKVNQFDCIILDLGLTDTSGFTLLEEIKKVHTNKDLKVFIYTARSLTSKEELFLNKYADTIIIKDSHAPHRLKEELELYLSVNQEYYIEENQDSDKFQKTKALEGKQILLVDDDVRNVYALSSVLEMHGMKILFAENGREALEMLDKKEEIDLVLMDIMMPEIDGYEAIRRIRLDDKLKEIPVIALTAKAMKEDREKCLKAGASDYITKPIQSDQLLSLISVWLYPVEGRE
ncbi:response regulator [Niallia sp. HCP3S3_B10]|uniref:response regulator n=1 Tax=Bacillaceae TaxID=186817 RepID=UPI0006922EA4|nr:response regulator [Bacillus sp. MB2021]